ncbi:MAG TPA: flavin reductase family protein [Jatrophihabitans sp.]|jgi:flavin reductase (DIM6/NTAB) family NADH-FMN oxidoreductase RutF
MSGSAEATAGEAVRTTDVTPEQLREAVGRFATGVTVVTALDLQAKPVGCTVSAFSSLSLRPPLVLVCIDTRRFMHGPLTSGPGFAVNVLAADQRATALRFATPAADKFATTPHHPGRSGIPLLDGALAHVQCDLHAVHEGGDHAIIVGRVSDVRTTAGEPLLYAQGAFLDVDHRAWEHAAAAAPPEWLLSAAW